MKQKRIGSSIIVVLVMIYLLIPLAVTIIYSLFEQWTDIVPRGFSFSAYAEIFQDKEFLLSLGRTVVICIIPVALTIVLVLLALFVTTIYFPKLEQYVQIICMIPYTIQGVILSVSILGLYVSNPTFLGNRIVMLIGAYCIIILPYIYQGIRNGMRSVNMPMLLEAAEMLGASKLYAFFKVIVPNILSAIVVSSLLAIGIIFGDGMLVHYEIFFGKLLSQILEQVIHRPAIVHIINLTTTNREKIIREILAEDLDALLWEGPVIEADAIAELRAHGLPVISMKSAPSPGCDCVYFDMDTLGAEIAKRLLRKKRKNDSERGPHYTLH